MLRRAPLLAAILAVLLAGCTAAGAAVAPSPTATVGPTPSPTATPTPTPEPTPAGFVQSYEQCKAVVQSELDLVAEISGRLLGQGINVKDYGPLVNTLSSAGPHDLNGLPGGTNRFCRNVAVQDAASAALDHMQALEGWKNCLQFPTAMKQPCIDKIVQRWWSKATNDYNRVLADMTNLEQGLVPPLDPNPIYDQEAPKASHTPTELASMACDREYGPVVSDLFVLGRSLAEGITMQAYGDKLTTASKDLQKADTAGLDGTCLISVGAVVTTILSDHVDAWTAWQACADKTTTQAKFDSCFKKNVDAVWNGRLTANYTLLFDAMGTLYFNQLGLIPPF